MSGSAFVLMPNFFIFLFVVFCVCVCHECVRGIIKAASSLAKFIDVGSRAAVGLWEEMGDFAVSSARRLPPDVDLKCRACRSSRERELSVSDSESSVSFRTFAFPP